MLLFMVRYSWHFFVVLGKDFQNVLPSSNRFNVIYIIIYKIFLLPT